MSHAERLAECKKRRPSFNIVVDQCMLVARWMEPEGPMKQCIARVRLAEELLVRACLAIIMGGDEG